MFTGKLCTYNRPFLRFNGPDAGGSSNPPAPGADNATPNPDEFLPGDADLDDAAFLAKRGFPRKTEKADMTPEQQTASWRYESKKQQHRADALERDNREWGKLGNRDDLIAAQQQAEEARRNGLSDDQRSREDAINDARTEGERAAAARLLPAAIESYVVAATKGADEKFEDALARVKTSLEYVDTSKFVDDKGAIDTTKLAAFAATLTPSNGKADPAPGDPLFQMLQRQTPPAPGGGSSIAEIRKRTRDALSPAQQ